MPGRIQEASTLNPIKYLLKRKKIKICLLNLFNIRGIFLIIRTKIKRKLTAENNQCKNVLFLFFFEFPCGMRIFLYINRRKLLIPQPVSDFDTNLATAVLNSQNSSSRLQIG